MISVWSSGQDILTQQKYMKTETNLPAPQSVICVWPNGQDILTQQNYTKAETSQPVPHSMISIWPNGQDVRTQKNYTTAEVQPTCSTVRGICLAWWLLSSTFSRCTDVFITSFSSFSSFICLLNSNEWALSVSAFSIKTNTP